MLARTLHFVVLQLILGSSDLAFATRLIVSTDATSSASCSHTVFSKTNHRRSIQQQEYEIKMTDAVCRFDNALGPSITKDSQSPHSHSHEHHHNVAEPSHFHGPGEHGHTHEHLADAGKYADRDLPAYEGRNWQERGFTIGIGGPVGSGKTALTLALCKSFRDKFNIGVVTNDIFTREDQEFLIRNEALADKNRIRAIETGGCPHAAIREDISANMHALEELQSEYHCQMLFVESGGDNLAANYSRELADYIIYVIDVSGGDKIPRKGGPGISQSDLLIINKTDLAPYVGASLEVMKRDANKMRDVGPTLFTSIRNNDGVKEVADLIEGAWRLSGGAQR